MQQLTSVDAQFLAMETSEIYGHVAGLAVYDPTTAPDGRLGVEDVCRLIGERVHLLPPFRRRLATVPFDLDHPYWIDDPDFDLDFHVRESAVPPPGDDRQLAETVARIVARPLDRAHPLWEVYVIHGLRGGNVAVLSKVHHAAVDGISGAEILNVLLDADPAGRELSPPAQSRPPKAVPSQGEMLLRGVAGLPRQPVRALRGLPTTLAHLEDVPGVGAIPGSNLVSRAANEVRRRLPGQEGEVLDTVAVRAPRTRFNDRVSAHRRFAFGSLSLDQIKAVKNAFGMTVNDVVMATCAGALRDWLLARGELPEEPLVAMVPLSVRTAQEQSAFGNRVSAMFVPIPTDLSDPVARLQAVHETMLVAKERFKAVPATMLQDVSQMLPAAVFTRASRVTAMVNGVSRLRPLNVVISNVPGARTPLYFAGARLVAQYPVSVVSDGAGLNITCQSYLDRVDFGVVGDRDQLDDAWSVIAALETSLAELDDALGATGATGATAAKAPKATPKARS
jgi:diacylglycerol O-acyltransferase / wax synthase